MRGLEIEAVYEHGTLKLPRELPLVEGATVTLTIHPPGRPGVIKHVCIPWTGDREECDRWLNDPDEGLFGCHEDDLPVGDPISLDPNCVVYPAATESRSSLEGKMIPETISLFRPVGQKELELIRSSGMRVPATFAFATDLLSRTKRGVCHPDRSRLEHERWRIRLYGLCHPISRERNVPAFLSGSTGWESYPSRILDSGRGSGSVESQYRRRNRNHRRVPSNGVQRLIRLRDE